MYWYIKYPLIALLVLCVLGLGSLVFRGCRKATPPETPEPAAMVVNPANPGTPAPSPSQNRPATTPPVVKKVIPELEEELKSAEAQLAIPEGHRAARNIAYGVLSNGAVVEFDEYWYRAVAIINEANRKIMNSPAAAEEKQWYTVQPGNSLERIARSKHTAVEALMRMNEIKRPADGSDPILHPRDSLCFIDGKWSIRVSKRQHLLILYFEGNNFPKNIYRVYQVGIGRDNRTPAGTFIINDRVPEPAWRGIPYGDPENELGTRWLKLVPIEGTDPALDSYGIHGTWDPDSIGKNMSLGCVRMRNEEVEELYDFIPKPGGSAPPVQVVIEE